MLTGDIVHIDGRPAHRQCLDHYNSTIQCGLTHGDCLDPGCCLSKKWDGSPHPDAGLTDALIEAWLKLSREERARRLGQTLSEWPDGAGMRYSHDSGSLGSGVFRHVDNTPEAKRAAIALLA